MKRILFILCLGSWLLALSSSPLASSPNTRPAEKNRVGFYTDDAYYWPTVDTIQPTTPVYDRNAREFIFLEDTTQYPDTVVMIIKN